ncbi:hypothetical protein SERLADRAFT_452123 [Serpula lacrymans var. lacrymans S7.9]|uniref:DNA-directed DNA polymerase n=1 Tax=Serpula lacrymans var. lacrymans (strain S7.9) TaxID=578457 RepID=F8P6B3_SERL9|nr:uncharacterized protein SERLADRAFT_452123 [Serpula lacrymans var. lacrymans S7.9]EGO20980.1 hypothetical protein SERLADRAFT_452123 [Serpula lacrymans var. lacrymans S7.9]
MATTLPLFWDLSSSTKKDRIDASVKLIGALEQFQAQYIPKDSPDGSDDEDEDQNPNNDGLDTLNAQDVSYSIRRLVRGLASPRESSRLGFAVALTELLSRLDTITCSQTVALLLNYTKTNGSMTGQEERDMIFARLFGFTAIIQSGLLVRQRPLPTSASSATLASSLEGFNEVLTELIVLGDKKSWLRESAWWSIGLAIDVLSTSDAPWKKEAFEATIQSIFVDQNIWTPEKVAVALKMQLLVPQHNWQKTLSTTFKSPDLLSPVNLSALAQIMKETSSDDGVAVTVSSSNWKPQIHYAWDIILDRLPSSGAQSKNIFREFFRVVVDESLFSSTSSTERKYWGFQVFQKALPRVAATDLPLLFTKNFMRTWINHLSNNDRYLHKIAIQVAKDIQAFVQKNPASGLPFILQLTGVNGNYQFDKLTKTKTVESILASMDSEGIKSYIDYLFQQVNNIVDGPAQDDIPAINARRAWIGSQLAALIHNKSIPKSDDWIQPILDWFVVNGLFILKAKNEKSVCRALHSLPSPSFSDDLRQNYRDRLLSCLADLTGQTTAIKIGDKIQKASAVAADGELWVSKVLSRIEQLEKDTKHVSSLAEDDEEDVALRTRALQVVKKLKKASDSQGEQAKGAELLIEAILIQQYCADEDAVEMEVLESCIEATNQMFLVNKKGKKSRKSVDNKDGEQTPDPIDVFVDTIIGFLERPSTYMRTTANQSFSLLTGAVQESTIELIVRQLERRDPAELATDGDSDEEEEVEDNLDDENDESDDGVTSAGEESEDLDDAEDALQVRAKIEEALRANGIEAATGDSDADTDEDLMDDDQMMAIDEHLAEVFRSRSNEKASKDYSGVDAQREATHFKNRVLDLIDTYIKKQPTSSHNVLLVLPLVEIVTTSGLDERQLVDKTTGLLKSRFEKPKDVPSNANVEQVKTLLEELHQRARKTRSSDSLTTLSFCSLYLSKMLLQSNAEESIHHIYQQSFTDFITRKASHLNVNFFQDYARRYPLLGWKLKTYIIEVSGEATNIYRKCQAFQLLQVIVNQLPSISYKQDEVVKFMTALRHALLDLISSACDERAALTAAQIKELLKLGLLAIRQTTKALSKPSDIETIWDPSSWKNVLERLSSSSRFKSSTALLKMCEQIAKSAKIASPEKINGTNGKEGSSKRKAGDVSEGEGGGSKKAKQKRAKKSKA